MKKLFLTLMAIAAAIIPVAACTIGGSNPVPDLEAALKPENIEASFQNVKIIAMVTIGDNEPVEVVNLQKQGDILFYTESDDRGSETVVSEVYYEKTAYGKYFQYVREKRGDGEWRDWKKSDESISSHTEQNYEAVLTTATVYLSELKAGDFIKDGESYAMRSSAYDSFLAETVGNAAAQINYLNLKLGSGKVAEIAVSTSRNDGTYVAIYEFEYGGVSLSLPVISSTPTDNELIEALKLENIEAALENVKITAAAVTGTESEVVVIEKDGGILFDADTESEIYIEKAADEEYFYYSRSKSEDGDWEEWELFDWLTSEQARSSYISSMRSTTSHLSALAVLGADDFTKDGDYYVMKDSAYDTFMETVDWPAGLAVGNGPIDFIKVKIDSEKVTEIAISNTVEGVTVTMTFKYEYGGVSLTLPTVRAAVRFYLYEDAAGETPSENPDIGITTEHITRADVVMFLGKPAVQVSFNDEGTTLFRMATMNNLGKYIKVTINDVTMCVVQINEPVTDGKPVITGSFTAEDADELAKRIMG